MIRFDQSIAWNHILVNDNVFLLEKGAIEQNFTINAKENGQYVNTTSTRNGNGNVNKGTNHSPSKRENMLEQFYLGYNR